jgi:hypothetical protein
MKQEHLDREAENPRPLGRGEVNACLLLNMAGAPASSLDASAGPHLESGAPLGAIGTPGQPGPDTTQNSMAGLPPPGSPAMPL